jgi:hypothetical protein
MAWADDDGVVASRRQPAAEVEMSRGRWALWLGPPIAVLAIGLVLSRFQPGAEAGGRSTAPPTGDCAVSPVATDAAGTVQTDVGSGAWWRLAEKLDEAGSMAGRELAVGRGGATGLALDLAVESTASGPVGGVVVVASDDGRRSTVRLVSAVAGCSWLVHQSQDVVRGAILDPSDGTVLGHLVERATRADLGTWRFGAPGALTKPVLVAPPLDAGDKTIWVTDLRLDQVGGSLAVQSCGEASCLTRIFDLQVPGAAIATLEGEQGALIGLAGGRLVTWSACPNLPCSILTWDIATGARRQVIDAAQAAAVTADGRWLVATLDASAGRTLRYELGTGAHWLVRGVAAGELVLRAGAGATSGLQLKADEVGTTLPGAIPHPFRPAAAEVIP